MAESVVKIALGVVFCMVASAASAEDAKSGNRGVTAPVERKNRREVSILRLKYADPATVVSELSGILTSSDLRMAAVKSMNSIVVLAPRSLQRAVAELISDLDVPQPARDDRGTAMAVVRVSPATAKALEVLGSRPGRPPVAAPPAGNPTPAKQANSAAGKQGTEVTVLRIPSDEIAALAKALAEVSASHGPRIQTVVVTPSRGSTQEAKRPGATGGPKR